MERTQDGGIALQALLIIGVSIILVPVLMMVFAMPMMGMMGWWMGTDVGIQPFWGIVMMLLFLLLFLVLAYGLYRALVRGSLGNADPAIEELRLAYARGDLSDEEFEQRREQLEQ